MKKILVCLTLAAFATVTSLQAAEQGTKDKAAACTDSKSCCSAKTTSTTTACCSTAKVAKKNVDVAKGAVLLVQR